MIDFETLINKAKTVKDYRKLLVGKYKDLSEEIKIRLIYEWTIFNNEQYIVELANQVIKNNDNEPYIESRIAKQCDVSIALASVIKEYVLKIEDEEIYIDDYINNYKAMDELNRKINLSKLERISNKKEEKMFNEELNNIIKFGDPNLMLIASKISEFLLNNGHYYSLRGELLSSFVAYCLKIHDVNTCKHRIDSRFCYGANFDENCSIDFVVANDYQKTAIEDISSLLSIDAPIGKLYYTNKKDNRDYIIQSSIILFKNPSLIKACKLIKDGNNKETLCFNSDLLEEFQNDLIRIYILADWTSDFLQRMNKVYPINKIDLSDVSNLNYLLKNNATSMLNKTDVANIKQLLNKNEELTYDALIDALCYGWMNLENKVAITSGDLIVSEDKLLKVLKNHCSINDAFKIIDSIRMGKNISGLNIKLDNSIKTKISNIKFLTSEGFMNQEAINIIRKSFYFKNFPDASIKELISCRFPNTKINKQNIIKVNNDLKIKELLVDYHIRSFPRFIGIFFFINRKLTVYKERLKVDESSDFIDADMGHFELFNSLKLLKEFEYSMFPRGRILYNNKENIFYVYADKSILNDKEKIDLLVKEFNLPKINTIFKTDEHYKVLNY